ncbi:MAG: hypothetical protein H8E12_19680 [Rhodobacteraceae bacterium]|nr:hypothetical protein [Paracoccaceae bacterium]
MKDLLVGDVIEVRWHEFDTTPEIGVFAGMERGYCLLTTRSGHTVPFLINSVIIKKLDEMPRKPLPMETFFENIKENKSACMIFFVAGGFVSFVIERLFL